MTSSSKVCMKLQHVRFALFHVFQSDLLSLGKVAFVERNFVSDIKYLSYRYLVNGNGLQATFSKYVPVLVHR